MRQFSKAQEVRVAKQLGGKVQANSGATAFDKGDVITKHWAIECKTSVKEKKSQSIKKEWLDGIQDEAYAIGKAYGAVVFDFGDGEDYAVIKLDDFNRLVRADDDE